MLMTPKFMTMTIKMTTPPTDRLRLVDHNLAHPSTVRRMDTVIKVNMGGMARTTTHMVDQTRSTKKKTTRMICGDCIVHGMLDFPCL